MDADVDGMMMVKQRVRLVIEDRRHRSVLSHNIDMNLPHKAIAHTVLWLSPGLEERGGASKLEHVGVHEPGGEALQHLHLLRRCRCRMAERSGG